MLRTLEEEKLLEIMCKWSRSHQDQGGKKGRSRPESGRTLQGDGVGRMAAMKVGYMETVLVRGENSWGYGSRLT